MPSFSAGQPIRQRQLKTYASVEKAGASELFSEVADEGAVATSSDFGFAEAEISIDSIAEPEYQISKAVTGFAPRVSDIGENLGGAFARTQSFAYLLGKCAFDVVFATIAMAIVSPLMLVIAIAIKLTSPGPVLFAQERVGRDGIFRMLKFRSMYVNDCSDTHHTVVGDARITPVGALLRRTSLDELPQLFNVLRGEMSIVGPRPELVKFVHKFCEEIPNYMARHVGKGGITGWAQVNGFRGSTTSIAVRVEYDLEYLRNWSFWLDMKIIWTTIFNGLFRNAF